MSLNFDSFFGAPTSYVPGPYFLAAGCSHTSAVGVDADQCWAGQLAQRTRIKTCNLAEAGGNAWIASVRIAQWILVTGRPEFVVAQWPHPIRTVIWKNGQGNSVNVHDTEDHLFHTRLRYGDSNYWAEWMQAIITTNAICVAAKIPIINWSLDNVDPHYLALLKANGIVVHDQTDQPRWEIDRLGSDQQHAGPLSHAQWAQQLQEMLNAITTR
jgi:hypothetical protein